MEIRIVYDRKSCIASGNCAHIDPEHFSINKRDKKADLIKGKGVGSVFVLETKMNDKIIAAAHSCPMSAIEIFNKKGKRIA